jgi:hypothetical protein
MQGKERLSEILVKGLGLVAVLVIIVLFASLRRCTGN